MEEIFNKIKKNILIIIVMILILIIGILIGRNIKTEIKDNEHKDDNKSNNTTQDDYKFIRIDEVISKNGKIENLEDIQWNNANITQDDKKIEISIDIDKLIENQKVESRTLTVKLLDPKGEIIASKDVIMEEISEDKNYTKVKLELKITETVLIDDIQIIAK